MTAPARLFFLLAREAPTAVIFRRGPSKQVRLLRWNLEDDTFEPGHWLRGRIYERRTDLTPDGRLLVYFAMGRGGKTYTAISRPPYLTALALWFSDNAWSGGGLFDREGRLELNDGGLPLRYSDEYEAPRIPIGRLDLPRGEDSLIEVTRMTRDGFTLVDTLAASISEMPPMPVVDPALDGSDLGWLREWLASVEVSGFSRGYTTARPRRMERVFAGKTLVETMSLDGFTEVRRYAVDGLDLTGAAQADWDAARRRLVFVRDGKIFAWGPSHGGAACELFDANSQRFESFPPPDWARQWP